MTSDRRAEKVSIACLILLMYRLNALTQSQCLELLSTDNLTVFPDTRIRSGLDCFRWDKLPLAKQIQLNDWHISSSKVLNTYPILAKYELKELNVELLNEFLLKYL